MKSSNRLIVGILVVTVLAVGFWMLLLSPKRKEASELSAEVEQQHAALTEWQGKATQAEEAKREFPNNYHQLVVLGQAVPASDETSSLLVELNQIANRSHVKFQSISLDQGSEESKASSTTAPHVGATASAPPGSTLPPTEATAALLPLGASIGPAGLAVMPYTLTFEGNFFHVADFIHGIDALLKTTNSNVAVDGRLITLNSFMLSPGGETTSGGEEAGSSELSASFSVTTYLVPPSQGVTAGATPTEPASTTAAAPASGTTATQTSYSTSSGGPAQ